VLSELEPRLEAELLNQGTSKAIAKIVSSLDRAIGARYPNLNSAHRERAALILLERLVAALNSADEEIGFYRQNPDGSIQITTIAIESVTNEVAGGRA